jgi:hypothetical protein
MVKRPRSFHIESTVIGFKVRGLKENHLAYIAIDYCMNLLSMLSLNSTAIANLLKPEKNLIWTR